MATHSSILAWETAWTEAKASILRHSAFFIVQLSHPHVTTGKTIAYVNHEIPNVQAGFRKGRGTRDQITNTQPFPISIPITVFYSFH